MDNFNYNKNCVLVCQKCGHPESCHKVVKSKDNGDILKCVRYQRACRCNPNPVILENLFEPVYNNWDIDYEIDESELHGE